MPRQANIAIENNFTRGYITEATGLNFPSNAATDTANCVFEKKGSVTRRLGFEFESDFQTINVNRSDAVVKAYLWKDVTGDGTLTFVVLQAGDTLEYFDASSTGSISSNNFVDTTDLMTFSPVGAESPKTNECTFSEGLGKLFVVHPNLEPFFVTFDPATTLFTETQITVEERDFERLTDNFTIGQRPTGTYASQIAEYRYNLDNAGWYFDSRSAVTAWDAARTDLPSDSDVWWFYKDASDNFSTSLIDKRTQGNTKAPRGHFILNVFDKDRSAVSGIAGLTPVTTGTTRFTANAFFAGRVWYAGLQSGKNSSRVFYSQIIESDDQIGRCYQANDPTSEINFDLLDNDGGVIQIPDAGYVVKLWPLKSAILVFTTNGIWSISGSSNIFGIGGGFKATDLIVSKISSNPALTNNSFIDVEGLPSWWNSDGIHFLTQDSNDKIQINNITDDTIRDFYLNIPLTSKQKARGQYNQVEKTINWLFRSDSVLDVQSAHEFDRVLTYNVQTQAFSPWELQQSTNVQVHDVLVIETPTTPFTTTLVEDNAAQQVQTNTGEDIVIFEAGTSLQTPLFKYVCSFPGTPPNWELTFAEVKDPTYKDWSIQNSSTQGIDYSSFFETAYMLAGDTQRFFQPNYVYIFAEPETTNSCLMQGKFDYSNDEKSNKQSVQQQIYPSNTSFRDTVIRRLKVRGKGRVLQLRFDSETSAPFTISGWSIYETSNAAV